MPTQMPFTACFDSLRPKKNMQAAPRAGNSGIIQMWSRKNMYKLSAVSYQPSVNIAIRTLQLFALSLLRQKDLSNGLSS